MNTQCTACGSAVILNFIADSAVIACKSASCGHRRQIQPHRENHVPVIAAGHDCPYTNQCREAADMNCHRAAFQGEDFPCVFARMFEGVAA